MLSPSEFVAGEFAVAELGSLIIPFDRQDATVIIGKVEKEPVAVFLGGQFEFLYFPSAGSVNWSGLIVPGVRIEVDETSMFNPASNWISMGALIRQGTTLAVNAKTERSMGRGTAVVLQSGLAPSLGGVGFFKWQVVLGDGHDKRVLCSVQVKGPN